MRIRSIKPEFWRSEDIGIHNIEDRLLFIGLWSYVDDNGVGRDSLALIAADLFAEDLSRDPRDTFARVSRGILHLSEAGRIVQYAVNGKPFLYITNWDKHQRIDRPAKARYPLPASADTPIRDTLATPSRESRDILATGTGEQGIREQGNKGSGVLALATLTAPTSKGSRLPADWMPSKDAIDKMNTEHPGMDLQSEHRIFVDYWLSVPGARGVKLEWDRVWCNWMRKEAKKGTGGGKVRTFKQQATHQIMSTAMQAAMERDAAREVQE